ncbi:oxidoreductase [Aquibacillus koreensis]|uniref:Oxidoreductase n=1 Tax=Aquibacillus koreensis TaxID=279446 RepID=A0A9X3WGJ8_9BACI|nr:oxidoreductase [Aquibacillus koreensis]MCT2536439.1 oxidoreductase [Aquibacillus koreensis]MDC3419472.1 oxidoreductase [Aquibacillus koreensis]
MKKTIITISITILIGLVISIIYNQNPIDIKPPHLTHTIDQENAPQQEPQPEVLQPVNNNELSYTLQNDEVNITYNGGNDWIKVPIVKDALFAGEYQGNKQQLISDSYVLTEARAAFLYQGGDVLVKYTLDQGETWQDSVIFESFHGLRFRKIDFIDDQFGYAILSGGRTMSSEYSNAFLTHDGGATWEATAEAGSMRLIADGGFVDANTGFLSYGTINPEEPDVYVTTDGGKSWRHAVFQIPSQYERVFVQAETPVKEGDHLAVLLNQGPTGDYQGGKVKGKFISKDNGLTWEFSEEVEPNETEQG